jgi:hypothetical protein
VFGIGDKLTITFIVFAELQSAVCNITVIFIMFAELGAVPQITILADYGFGRFYYFNNPLANYENPKLIAVRGTITIATSTTIPVATIYTIV